MEKRVQLLLNFLIVGINFNRRKERKIKLKKSTKRSQTRTLEKGETMLYLYTCIYIYKDIRNIYMYIIYIYIMYNLRNQCVYTRT